MESRGTRTKFSQTTARAQDYFDKFCSADSLESTLTLYKKLCDVIKIKPNTFPNFFPKLSSTLTSFDAQDLLSKYAKRAAQKCYENGKACEGCKVLIIGAGPCGLRTAIEAQLLGAKVVVIEKRDSFSRNNVLHLWPFVICDLKGLGAKKFYGKFCAGAIDHISICKLQFMLLKIALLVGVEVHFGVGFENIVKPGVGSNSNKGWTALLSPENHVLSNYEFDVLIGADGRRNSLKGFKRKVLRAKLAIAITANFVNSRTAAEAKVQEISGVSFVYKQDFFNQLCQTLGIDLENIVYYKDETHYFVMTAKKHSLLWKGVLREDHPDTDTLLAPSNINKERLENYVIEAVRFATNSGLPNLQFARNYREEPDLALIDFTSMYAAENACRVVQRKGKKLLLGLVGDSLLEPFWPQGTGTARGFLSSFDLCWVLKSWVNKSKSVVEVIAERESMYRLLAQTTHENLAKDHAHYTVDPRTRYPHINLDTVKPFQVQSLFDSDEKQDTDSKSKNNSNSNANGTCSSGGKSAQQKTGSISTPSKKLHTAEKATTLYSPKHHNRKEKQAAPSSSSSSSPSQRTETLEQNEDFPDLDEILDWYREHLKECEIKIDGIQDIFVQGNTLCAILNRFRPDLLEYPVPPEVQQGNDETEQAAFRNQLAFDFLKSEYFLPSPVSGLDALKNFSANLSNLIQYAVNVYETFKYLNPQPPIKFPTFSDQSCESGNESPTSPCSDNASTGGYFSSSVWTSSTNYLEDGNVPQDGSGNVTPESPPESAFGRKSSGSGSGSGLRRSSSIQRIVQRLDNNKHQQTYNNHNHNNNVKRTPSFHQFHDDSENTCDSSSEVYINPYRTINNEIKRKRLEEAERTKVETLRLVHLLQTNQKETRDEERAKEREKFIRSQRALSQYEPVEENSTSNFKTIQNDDFFNEYNMRLWKSSRPSIGERTHKLENKLLGLERKSSFNERSSLELPIRQQLRPTGLMRSATEKHVQRSVLPSVQKLKKDGSIVQAIEKKYAEGHGHVSLKTKLEPKQEKKTEIDLDSDSDSKGKERLAPNVTPSLNSKSTLALPSKMVQRAHTFAGKESIKTSASCTTIGGAKKSDKKSSEKKSDFSEYFKAMDALKAREEQARAKAMERMNARLEAEAREKEEEEKKLQAMKDYAKKVEQDRLERKQRMEEEARRVKAEEEEEAEKLKAATQSTNEKYDNKIPEKSHYEITSSSKEQTAAAAAKTAMNRRSMSIMSNVSTEFDELCNISEDDEEELFANLSLKDDEVKHLLDWTEKNFNVRT